MLDSIGNGVQVLQAANTGITSLSKLVDTAKSIANQALQQPGGYSTKSSVQFTGATASPTGTVSATDLNEGVLAGQKFVFKTSAGTTTITLGSTPSALSGGAATVQFTGISSTRRWPRLASTWRCRLANTDTLTFTSTNDGAGQIITKTGTAPTTLDAVDITSTTASNPATGGTAVAAVADTMSQTTRASLVAQYNQIIQQITTTAQDASFNGVNLLNGDTLKLVFNETGKSTSTIAGVTFDPNGLGLKSLTVGTDFIGQRRDQHGSDGAQHRQHHAALAGFGLRCQPLDRADSSGLLEEPDQRAADRVVQPDPGRCQRGSGQQPGAVDPPVDRGLRAGARQPVEPERSPAPALISANHSIHYGGGASAPPFFCV